MVWRGTTDHAYERSRQLISAHVPGALAGCMVRNRVPPRRPCLGAAVIDVKAKRPAQPELACGALKEQAPEPSTSMPAGYEELPDKDVAVIRIVAPQNVGQDVIAATCGRSERYVAGRWHQPNLAT